MLGIHPVGTVGKGQERFLIPIMSIIYRTWQPGDDELLHPLLTPSGFYSEGRYKGKFEDPGIEPESVQLALCDDIMAGHVICYRRRFLMFDREEPVGGLGMVFVDERFRGRGIGKELMRRSIEYHISGGQSAITLFTYRTLTPAYVIYQSLGFGDGVEREIYQRALKPDEDFKTSMTVRSATLDDLWEVDRLTREFSKRQCGYTAEFLDSYASEDLAPEFRIVETGSATAGVFQIRGSDSLARLINMTIADSADASEAIAAALAHLTEIGYETAQIFVNANHILLPALEQMGFEKSDKEGAVLMMKPLAGQGSTSQVYPAGAPVEMEYCLLW